MGDTLSPCHVHALRVLSGFEGKGRAVKFLVYYGHAEELLPQLRECDVLVFEPRGWSESALRELRAPGGPKLIGYLSAFAWPEWAGRRRWWWGKPEHDPEWDAWWLSLSSFGWRYKVGRLWRDVRLNCDGIFLDNLDRLEQDPKSLRPLLKLLEQIRGAWPEVYLLGNRGFGHWKELRSHLSGVLFENMTDAGFGSSDRAWVKEQLDRLRHPGIDIYALDYQSRFDAEESEALRGDYPKLRYYCAPDQGLQSLA